MRKAALLWLSPGAVLAAIKVSAIKASGSGIDNPQE